LSQETGLGDYKFRAFISYSHADENWGAWLQRSLERFRAPKEFAARLTEAGKPLRLAPVFRDREDLPVAGNLNDAIRQALADSEFQIVLCSPNAATSRWVNEEIKLFNRLHGSGRTFAIIVAGEPGSGGDTECFPPALRFKLDRNGEMTAEPAEPLAADAREEGDGKRVALLKTAAGILGVGLDDLVRRDAKARTRRMQAIAAGASAIAGVMAFAAVFAINQRNEAQRARGEAEDLIEFMLTDLSDRLEPVGRLDILEEVGGEVLDYYDNQNIRSLDAKALSRRARGVLKLGNVDERRGDLDAALKAYEAAFASTAEQLRRAPNDPDRIFDHAQSVFYVGNIAVERGDFEKGDREFGAYYELAQKLVDMDRKNPKWRLELAYATSNLGALAYYRGAYSDALPYFKESAEIRGSLANEAPGDRKMAFAHAYALSWQAYAQIALGDYSSAIEQLERQLAIYDAFDASFDDFDFESLEKQVTAERRLSEAYLGLGQFEPARAANERAANIGERLLKREPSNSNSLTNVALIETQRSYLDGLEGDKEGERAAARKAVSIFREVWERDRAQISSKRNFGYALIRLVTCDPLNSNAEAREIEALIGESDASTESEDLDFFASATLALVMRARISGDSAGAKARAAKAASRLAALQDQLTAGSRQNLAQLLAEAGDNRSSIAIVEDLIAQGARHPELISLRTRLVGNASP
jgi:tetratricopeptide (TPR) repeat protein